MAFSAKGDNLVLLVDCQEAGAKLFNRSMRGLDNEGNLVMLHDFTGKKVFKVRSRNVFFLQKHLQ